MRDFPFVGRYAELSQQQQPPAVIRADTDKPVARALFAPFDESSFPRSLDAVRLRALLQTAPQSLVPCAEAEFSEIVAQWASSLPPLFTASHSEAAPKLSSFLTDAITAHFPPQMWAESLLTPTWDKLGCALPSLMAQLCGLPITFRRHVVDASLTTPGFKRDLLVWIKNGLAAGGEDKPHASQLQEAISECFDKHKPANNFNHGQLEYVLLVATAGTRMQVMALPVGATSVADMKLLLGPIQLDTEDGRCLCILAWISTCRWLATVLAMELLPDALPHPLTLPFERLSPYSLLHPVLRMLLVHCSLGCKIGCNHCMG
ncbi:hypothetical protein WJX73_010013 [Symbiochloris irregularis]|uniref:Uncharacterized protein n=1 Tax=Symbiochloris irregularis TaxID=706552 RepID=A0AAW1P2I0_9CHLO